MTGPVLRDRPCCCPRSRSQHYDQDWWHYSTAKSHSWDWPGKLQPILDLIGAHRELMRQVVAFEVQA
jgi:hypothetical protein